MHEERLDDYFLGFFLWNIYFLSLMFEGFQIKCYIRICEAVVIEIWAIFTILYHYAVRKQCNLHQEIAYAAIYCKQYLLYCLQYINWNKHYKYQTKILHFSLDVTYAQQTVIAIKNKIKYKKWRSKCSVLSSYTNYTHRVSEDILLNITFWNCFCEVARRLNHML